MWYYKYTIFIVVKEMNMMFLSTSGLNQSYILDQQKLGLFEGQSEYQLRHQHQVQVLYFPIFFELERKDYQIDLLHLILLL